LSLNWESYDSLNSLD